MNLFSRIFIALRFYFAFILLVLSVLFTLFYDGNALAIFFIIFNLIAVLFIRDLFYLLKLKWWVYMLIIFIVFSFIFGIRELQDAKLKGSPYQIENISEKSFSLTEIDKTFGKLPIDAEPVRMSDASFEGSIEGKSAIISLLDASDQLSRDVGGYRLYRYKSNDEAFKAFKEWLNHELIDKFEKISNTYKEKGKDQSKELTYWLSDSEGKLLVTYDKILIFAFSTMPDYMRRLCEFSTILHWSGEKPFQAWKAPKFIGDTDPLDRFIPKKVPLFVERKEVDNLVFYAYYNGNNEVQTQIGIAFGKSDDNEKKLLDHGLINMKQGEIKTQQAANKLWTFLKSGDMRSLSLQFKDGMVQLQGKRSYAYDKMIALIPFLNHHEGNPYFDIRRSNKIKPASQSDVYAMFPGSLFGNKVRKNPAEFKSSKLGATIMYGSMQIEAYYYEKDLKPNGGLATGAFDSVFSSVIDSSDPTITNIEAQSFVKSNWLSYDQHKVHHLVWTNRAWLFHIQTPDKSDYEKLGRIFVWERFDYFRNYLRVGDLTVTWGSLIAGFYMVLRAYIILILMLMFHSLIPIEEVKQALLTFRAKNMAYTLPISLNILPIIITTVTNTMVSFRLRGGFRRLSNLRFLVFTFLLNAIKMAEELAQIMEVNADYLFKKEKKKK